mmetsp:Transcript_77054/g.174273  ORF Transcript_77054/g.174273 Transcript_77054/m.174273 type:complete len:203 (-) Transcript_77054:503-1111(-)
MTVQLDNQVGELGEITAVARASVLLQHLNGPLVCTGGHRHEGGACVDNSTATFLAAKWEHCAIRHGECHLLDLDAPRDVASNMNPLRLRTVSARNVVPDHVAWSALLFSEALGEGLHTEGGKQGWFRQGIIKHHLEFALDLLELIGNGFTLLGHLRLRLCELIELCPCHVFRLTRRPNPNDGIEVGHHQCGHLTLLCQPHGL